MATVLVVDDEFGIATLLKDVLEDENHRVLLATNGKHALERIAEEQPQLIITDMMMPVMDGAVFVKALSATPTLSTIPVIIMSSLPEAAVKERCPNYAAFLRKPFVIFDVIDIVAGLIGPTAAL
jgi:CheY-like chemotaxis protein